MMNNSSVSGNWEELFDSGQLDRQLQQLKPFHSSQSNSVSTPTIITVQGEESSSSKSSASPLYRPSAPPPSQEPKLKILKRPSSSPNFQNQQSQSHLNQQQTQQHFNNNSSNSNSNTNMNSEQLSRHKKSLKQREEEYALARLRILGSAGTTPELPDFSVPPPPLPAKFAQQYRSVDNNVVVRPPKGPDGSRGFQK